MAAMVAAMGTTLFDHYITWYSISNLVPRPGPRSPAFVAYCTKYTVQYVMRGEGPGSKAIMIVSVAGSSSTVTIII